MLCGKRRFLWYPSVRERERKWVTYNVYILEGFDLYWEQFSLLHYFQIQQNRWKRERKKTSVFNWLSKYIGFELVCILVVVSKYNLARIRLINYIKNKTTDCVFCHSRFPSKIIFEKHNIQARTMRWFSKKGISSVETVICALVCQGEVRTIEALRCKLRLPPLHVIMNQERIFKVFFKFIFVAR